MDKLSHYRTVIKRLLAEYERLGGSTAPDDLVVDHAMFDDEHNRYILLRTGWWEEKRVNAAALYLRLHNDKIYIEEDWTEDGIAADLLEAGVPREDIVLAFHPPEMRQYTEFAVA